MMLVLALGCAEREDLFVDEEEEHEFEVCGPNADHDDGEVDKSSLLPGSPMGLTAGSNTIYPAYKSLWVRAYSLGENEKAMALVGAAIADYFASTVKTFNVVNAADATVNIRETDPPHLWQGCDGVSGGGCWLGGTSCVASVETTIPNVRLCTSWKIELNIPSIYLNADSNGISRESAVISVAAHEAGHTMGLRHRSGTLMASTTAVGDTPWPPVRFDDCQDDTLALFSPDYDDVLNGKRVASLVSAANSCF
jgi:hypothetical protein